MATVQGSDGLQREVLLSAPATRIISLAPHLTELLFAVGAGDQIVASVDHADYPPQALELPRVGNAHRLDLERILALRPDLIVAWASGNPRAAIEQLERFGIPIYLSEPDDFAGISHDLEQLGRLTGNTVAGRLAAETLRQQIADLRTRYSERPPVQVFYQVWPQPLMTVNSQHLLGAAIEVCGGVNIFADSRQAIPRVALESVLAADPEAIVAGGPGDDDPQWLNFWRKWSELTAVNRNNLFFVPPSLLQRHTPRIGTGIELLCKALDQARDRRPAG